MNPTWATTSRRDQTALEAAREYDAFYFIADYRALTVRDPEAMRHNIRSVAATWLACGLDRNAVLYRQSDIPETFELTWILSCVTGKA